MPQHHNNRINNYTKRQSAGTMRLISSTILIAVITAILCIGQTNAMPANETSPSGITLIDTVIKVDANPGSGFNFPYYLRIPKGLTKDKIQYLLVETNNTGLNDSPAFHEKEAYLEIIRNSLGSSLCNKLKTPFLLPVFPRHARDSDVYTHAFDRDAATIKSGDMKRLDLQLIAMIRNAKLVLKNYGIAANEKILMNGFSASGTFANRFTLIHPTLVAGTACGGINGIAILSMPRVEKVKLNYPIGINDFREIFGTEFNTEAYNQVPQFIYMGENDNNDAAQYDDAYSREERKIIFKVLGEKMMPDRFRKCESIYLENGTNSTFKIYTGIGHETDLKVYNEVAAFFSNIMAGK